MNDGHIAKRYAQALLDYAVEHGEDKLLYDRMKILTQTIAAAPRLMETLGSPVVPYSDKRQLLLDAVGAEAEESYCRFVQILLDNRRERLLRNIALNYISLYRQAQRIGVVSLVSVKPLPAAVVERIRENLVANAYSDIEIENRIDRNIKGGFIFQINDLRLDASVAGQLEKLRRQFIRKNKIIV
jgi:F-type H+-transporting ATPase subunit delta